MIKEKYTVETMENLRQELEFMVSNKNDLSNEQVLNLSKELDEVIMNFIKYEKSGAI